MSYCPATHEMVTYPKVSFCSEGVSPSETEPIPGRPLGVTARLISQLPGASEVWKPRTEPEEGTFGDDAELLSFN